MKAPAIGYLRARSLNEALAALAEHGDEAKIIAGGQSLVPALNLRLLAPTVLVDVRGLEELQGIAVEGDTVRVGALTRHVDLERSKTLRRSAPLLGRAIVHVAHPAIRNRGTLGGSIANADPASELPACALAMGATIVATSGGDERRIKAEDFFTGIYETALKPDEILLRVEFPADGPAHRIAFHELARRAGDYAIVGLAARAEVVEGRCQALRIAYFGVGGKATLASRAADALIGIVPDDAAVEKAAEALGDDLDPQDDLQASAVMRRHLARVLLRRAAADLFFQTATPVQREDAA